MPALLARWEAEIVGVLIIVAAALMWLGFHDASIKRATLAPVAAAAEAASAAQAIQKAQTDAAQAAALHEATAQNAARAVDAHDLAAAVAGADKLRDDAIRRSASASHPAAAQGGPAGSDARAGMVPESMLAAALSARADAESDAASLAAYADGLRTSGELCRADYSALGPVIANVTH